MKGHTGATLSLRKGAIYSGSWKQKMVAWSSTKSELIGMYDVLPQVLWTKQFLEEQGCLDTTTVVYQDNTSSILLERNGRSSSTKRTKHMHTRYFYVTEQVQNRNIHVGHCPMEEMVADFFTKPLQGSLFKKLRNYIMGNEEPGYQVLPRSVLSSDNRMSTRKQKFVGTRKQNSEAAAITKHAKDSDASNSDSHMKERQRTLSSMNGDDDVQLSQPCGGNEYYDIRRHEVEPRSYRDVVVSGQG